jgi:hypothetical protein
VNLKEQILRSREATAAFDAGARSVALFGTSVSAFPKNGRELEGKSQYLSATLIQSK